MQFLATDALLKSLNYSTKLHLEFNLFFSLNLFYWSVFLNTQEVAVLRGLLAWPCLLFFRYRYIWEATLLRRGRIDGGSASTLQWGFGWPTGGHLHETCHTPSHAATSFTEGIPGSCSGIHIWDQQAPRDGCISRARLLLPHTPAFIPALGLPGSSPVQHGPEPQQHYPSRGFYPGCHCNGHHASQRAQDSTPWAARASRRNTRTSRKNTRIPRRDSCVARRVTEPSGGSWTEGAGAKLCPANSLPPAGPKHRCLELDANWSLFV